MSSRTLHIWRECFIWRWGGDEEREGEEREECGNGESEDDVSVIALDVEDDSF